MPDDLGKPLTRFLIALGHSHDLLRRFRESPDAVLEEWGLQGSSAILHPDASLRQIQEAVDAEHAGEKGDALATWWIQVGGAPAQAHWIQSPSTDDDDDDDGGGGGGGKHQAQ